MALLCGQLGYPADREAVLGRMRQIAADPNRAVLVACVESAVVGWIDLSIEFHLQSEPVALIGGLVVADGARGQGVGVSFAGRPKTGPDGPVWLRSGSDPMPFGSGHTSFICGMVMPG